MTRSKLLVGAAALALIAAAPVASFAQGRHAGGGGGAHFSGGGGGGAHFSGGARMGGAPGGGASFSRGPGPSANFARSSAPTTNFARSSGPTANFAARSPNVNANVNVANRGAFAGNRTAWNGGGRGGYWRNGRWFPGAALAAGAVVGGALAANAYYGDPYYYGDTGPVYYGDYDNGPYETGTEVAVVQDGGVDASYCAQRYRSWDPASQTYLGYDGQRHPCP